MSHTVSLRPAYSAQRELPSLVLIGPTEFIGDARPLLLSPSWCLAHVGLSTLLHSFTGEHQERGRATSSPRLFIG